MTKKEVGVTLGRLIGAAHNDADTSEGQQKRLAEERALAYRISINALELEEKDVTEGYLQSYTGEDAGWQSRSTTWDHSPAERAVAHALATS